MCAANTASPPTELQMVSEEVMMEYTLPDDYAHNVVADGYTGVDEKGKPMTWLQQLHLVKPNGRTACDCTLEPSKVWNYTSVQTPPEWRDLLCEESVLYLRREVYRLENHRQSTG
jgi:hypothetical protein